MDHCNPPPGVWIIGSSLIVQLAEHARDQGLYRNLGLRCRISWDGGSGMRWEHLMPLLHRRRATTRYDPDLIIIHLGENDIGWTKRLHLLLQMKADIEEVLSLYPRSRVMFSNILPRAIWPAQRARSAYALERVRRFLNGAMAAFMSDRGMGVIKHNNIDFTFHLEPDGTHLSYAGLEVFLRNFECALLNVFIR